MARKDYDKDLYKNAGVTSVSEMIADRCRRWLGLCLISYREGLGTSRPVNYGISNY